MIDFECDYNNGAHPEVLHRLVETNGEVTATYGDDIYSLQAKKKIKEACRQPDAEVFFLTGGTQANATVIDAMLLRHEGVIAVETGHIQLHEAGAVEMLGHKVITLKGHYGKLEATELAHYLAAYHADEAHAHCVYPALVYITFPTELGTLYTQAEIASIYEVCCQYGVRLYIDGARMAYGLGAEDNTVTLEFLASHSHCFTIGGTKCGALSGEAVVFAPGQAPKHFFTLQKQHGAVVAKGRLHGIQFDALFSNSLYFRIGRETHRKAEQLRQILSDAGFPFAVQSPTNQQFVVLPNDTMEQLAAHVHFSKWEPADHNHTVCRFVVSWSTTENDLQKLREITSVLKK